MWQVKAEESRQGADPRSPGALPDTATADRASVNQGVDTIFFSDVEATAGTYPVGVYAPATAGIPAIYTLQTAPGALSNLNWDPGVPAAVLDFYTGAINTSLAPHASALYRVDVPAEATRWRHTATHAPEVVVCLEQGTLPRTDSFGSYWAQHGSWDADGDGLTNLEEYQLGANLTNGETHGRFDTIQITTSGEFQLHLVGEAGLRYELQSSDDLVNWSTLRVITNTSGALWLNETMPGQPARFYRTVIRP